MSAADVPLVGRGSELHDITSAFASSPCAAVVVAGPAGVGKSRLTADATAAIASGSRQVMHVIGSQAGAAIPFGAFVQLLPEAAPAAGTTLQLLQILSKAIAAYAHNGVPMLLLIEDAHLLDAGSAALVHQLVRSQACGVVASIRTPDVAPDPIVALWKDGLAQRIDLKPLNRAECDALAASYLGGVVASASLQWLWKTSAGNPLFMRGFSSAHATRGRSTTGTAFGSFYMSTDSAGTEPRDRDLAAVGALVGAAVEALAQVADDYDQQLDRWLASA